MLKLVWRNLWSHPLRSGLTFGSVVLAVTLLCVLRGTVLGLDAAVQSASTNRLLVQSAVSLYVDLPIAYESKIAQVDGVEWISKWQWFGGEYRDGSGFFAQFGIDPDTFLKSYPEVEIAEGSYEAFQQSRTGCMIGVDLVDKYGWQVGDSIPLIGKIYAKPGNQAWDFTVEAIYRSSAPSFDQQTMFFHYDYLRETLEQGGAVGPDGVGVYMLKLAPGAEATRVMADVDALFENGPQRVQTTTEAEFNRQFVTMLGNVPALLMAIGGAVVFAIFFAVLNTMLMAGRERVRDIGILKALGFADRVVFGILLSESLVLCVGGGAAGAALALAMEAPIQQVISAQIPGFRISLAAILTGVGIAVSIGLVAGVAPGWAAQRISPVRALRAEA